MLLLNFGEDTSDDDNDDDEVRNKCFRHENPTTFLFISPSLSLMPNKQQNDLHLVSKY